MLTEIIGVPLYYGCDNPGTELAYSTMIEAGLLEHISAAGGNISQQIALPVPPLRKKQADPSLKYLDEILETCHNLANAVDACLFRGNFPFIIGGDHSLGIGSIAGVRRNCPASELSVIWIDAHTDINTEKTSDSHHIHGMPLSACLGLSDNRLYSGFGVKGPFILPQNLIYIGSRSVDAGEWEILKNQNISYFDMKSINSLGIKEVAKQALALVKTPRIHVSFDVDFMDSAQFRATGLPIPNGPSINQTRECLYEILSDNRVGSMDFVEYSPVNDRKNKGLSTCFDLIQDCFSAMNK